jgi:Fe2+ or Zn2+ uptake regulation protein
MSKRNTIQRQLILDAVKELDIHATAEEVYKYLVAKHPSIGRATVYRNLSQMAESGEIMNIGDFYGATHYDHQCHPHYHIICEKCKRIFDIDDDFSDINERVKNVAGFDGINFNLTFRGLCQVCKA